MKVPSHKPPSALVGLKTDRLFSSGFLVIFKQ